MNKLNLDPITTEIIQSSLQAACDEMFVAMRKTAMSSIIYEVLDFGTAVTDSDGNIAASGAGIPAFIAMCDKAVQAVLINIFGGIVRCDVIADGIIEAVEQMGVNVPVVVRLEGNNAEIGSDKLSESGLNIISASGLEDAAKLVVGASKGSAS